MTEFEERLTNLRANLAAEKQSFRQERWQQLEAGELAEFKQRQEQLCSEGIMALQQQKNAAITQKAEELQSALDAEVERAFAAIDKALAQAQDSIPKAKEA